MKFAIIKNDKTIIKNELETRQHIAAFATPAFTNMLMTLSVNESMFHYDTMTNFKRIE